MISVKAIDALLPQTQCGECGYSGCLPYAEALAQGKTTIDHCPPGGVATVKALGELLHINAEPYLAEASKNTRHPSLAFIREAECIGCTKCIQACPVDAIVGSAKLMHTVLSTECTGCGLCVEPCPVDCIEMVDIPEASYDKNLARERANAKQMRQRLDDEKKAQSYLDKRQFLTQQTDISQEIKAKQDYIQQALARVQAKKKHE